MGERHPDFGNDRFLFHHNLLGANGVDDDCKYVYAVFFSVVFSFPPPSGRPVFILRKLPPFSGPDRKHVMC